MLEQAMRHFMEARTMQNKLVLQQERLEVRSHVLCLWLLLFVCGCLHALACLSMGNTLERRKRCTRIFAARQSCNALCVPTTWMR